MKFNPDKPAAEMTAAELMTAHVAMGMPTASPSAWVKKVKEAYVELNRQMGSEDEQDSRLRRETEALDAPMNS